HMQSREAVHLIHA
ncbi:hypothetical protein KIPB_016837, partial [Kipferlia bialata]